MFTAWEVKNFSRWKLTYFTFLLDKKYYIVVWKVYATCRHLFWNAILKLGLFMLVWLCGCSHCQFKCSLINSFIAFTRECWKSVVIASSYASCAENVVNVLLVANNCSTHISVNKMLRIFHLAKLILESPTLLHDQQFVSVIWQLQNEFSSRFGDIHMKIIWTWMFQNSFAIAHFFGLQCKCKGELQNIATLTDTFTEGITQQFHRSVPEIFSAVILFLTCWELLCIITQISTSSLKVDTS